MTQHPQPRPFDERAALEELERLADKIQISRRQRARAVAEFDAFVKTFKQDRAISPVSLKTGETASPAPISIAQAPVTPSIAPPRAPALPVAAAPPVVQPPPPAPSVSTAWTPPPSMDPLALGDAPNVAPSSLKVPEALAVSSAAARDALMRLTQNRQALALVIVALVLLVLLLWRPWQSSSPPPATPTQSAEAPAAVPTSSTPAPVAATPSPAASPAPGPPRAINIVLTTVRPVWARVIVDGRRAVERTIPAGEKIALGADREINIRAGDAGALQLTLEGKDQGLLGRDGIAVTKVLTAK